MRSVRIAMFLLFPVTVLANTPLCGDAKFQHADLLTPAQWQSVLAGEAGGDPVVQEEIEHQHARDQRDPAPKGPPTPISWTQATTLILLGTVRTAYQSHDLKVVLAMHSGRLFSAREPVLDDVFRIVAAADPCHSYIRLVTE